MSKAKGKIVIK